MNKLSNRFKNIFKSLISRYRFQLANYVYLFISKNQEFYSVLKLLEN